MHALVLKMVTLNQVLGPQNQNTEGYYKPMVHADDVHSMIDATDSTQASALYCKLTKLDEG